MPLRVEGRLYALNADAAKADALLVRNLLVGCCYLVMLSSNDLDARDALGHLFIAPSMIPAPCSELIPYCWSALEHRRDIALELGQSEQGYQHIWIEQCGVGIYRQSPMMMCCKHRADLDAFLLCCTDDLDRFYWIDGCCSAVVCDEKVGIVVAEHGHWNHFHLELYCKFRGQLDCS